MKLRCIKWVHAFIGCLFLTFTPLADADEMGQANRLVLTRDEMNEKLLLTTAAGVGAITVWGAVKWDYFTVSPHAKSEGWFGNDTPSGGADKFGHAFTSYVGTHGFAALYEHWDFSRDDAALYGAISSFVIMGYMEFGDSFSRYGLSGEDFAANAVGTLWGYLTYRDAVLASRLDFRWEYGIHPTQTDLVTDYENSKFLFALKLNGFDRFRESWMKHLEFHVGYYTRGFEDHDPDRERNLYAGVGLNLTDMLARHGYRKAATALRYLQTPGTYLSLSHDLN